METSWPNWSQLKSQGFQILHYLLEFAKNPLQRIRQIPEWSYVEIGLLTLILTIPSGVLSGLVSRRFSAVVTGLILSPIVFAIVALIATLLFRQTIQFVFQKTLPFRPLLALFVLSNIPLLLIRIAIPLLPPIEVLGYVFTAILLTVGLVENHHLPRQKTLKLVGAVFAIFFLAWIVNTVKVSREALRQHSVATPDSLEILEKELGKN